MNGITTSCVLWGWALIQIMGLVSAVAARVSEGSRRQTASHGVFFACLSLVGVATVVGLMISPDYWMISATILAVMVLIVTCDFSRTAQAASE